MRDGRWEMRDGRWEKNGVKVVGLCWFEGSDVDGKEGAGEVGNHDTHDAVLCNCCSIFQFPVFLSIFHFPFFFLWKVGQEMR
jgi:hypothetical protein